MNTIPIADLTAIRLVRLATARETQKTAGEISQAELEKSEQAQVAIIDQRTRELASQLTANHRQSQGFAFGFSIGAVIGAMSGLANTLVASAAFANPVALAIGAGFNMAMGAIFNGFAISALGKSIGVAAATPAMNRAEDAGFAADALQTVVDNAESAIGEAQTERDAGAKERGQVQKAVNKGQQADVERRGIYLLNLREGGGANKKLGKAATQVLSAQAQAELNESREARAESRDHAAEARTLRAQALELRRAAMEEQKSNNTWRAAIGIGVEVTKIASMVVSGGGTALFGAHAAIASGVVKLASTGVDTLSKGVIDDGSVRDRRRQADNLELSAKRISAKGDDARDVEKDAASRAEQALNNAEEIQDNSVQKGEVMVGKGNMSLGTIQTVRMQASLRDAQNSRKDAAELREGALAADQAALEAQKKADDKKSTLELVQLSVAAASTLVATGGLMTAIASQVTGQSYDTMKASLNVAEKGFGLGDATAAAILNPQIRAQERHVMAHEQTAKDLRTELDDAQDDKKAADDERQRAMDVALEMNRNLAPRWV